MNIIKSLFKAPKIVDAVINGADELHVSGEEKYVHYQKLLALYEPFKLVQRLLALVIIPPYVLMAVVGAVGMLLGWENAKAMIEAVSAMLGEIVAWITIFYFGGGAVEGIAERFMGRQTTKIEKVGD